MNHWPEVELGSVVELKRGYDLPKRLRSPGSVPIVSSSGISGWHQESKVEPPGVVTGRYGTLGEVFLLTEPFWPLNTSLYVRDFKGNHPRFVYYLLQTIDYLAYSDKAAVPGVNRNHVHRASVLLPPIPEQRAIARVLGTLDDKIELNREMSHTLEATAQAIFRSWFVDFDPVVAKADGRKPFGMSEDVAALFPDRFVESERGPIPEGWEWKTVSKALRVNPKRKLEKGEVAPYLGMADAPTQSAIPWTWGQREYGSGVRFKTGDTLMAKITPCLENGKTAYVGFLSEGVVGWGSTEFIVLAPRGSMPPEFPYFLARDKEFRAHAIANMTGSSGRQRVPISALKHYHIAIPSDDVLYEFGKASGPIMNKLVQNVRESQTLAELRDILLPKLLSGEIRVDEAEKTVEEAA